METKKMSLANIKGKLSRAEMKGIVSGANNTIAYVCGTRWNEGKCYCDVCENGVPTACDFPCGAANCGH